MGTIFTKSNLTKAGIVAIAGILASKLTAGKSALIQGGAVFAATLVAMPFAAKLGG